MWKQWLVALVLVAVGVGSAAFFWAMDSSSTSQAAGEPRVSKVSTVVPQLQRVRDEVHSVANLKALKAVELTTEVSGRVVEINLKPGQKVAEGDVLLRLDDRQAVPTCR